MKGEPFRRSGIRIVPRLGDPEHEPTADVTNDDTISHHTNLFLKIT